MSEPEVPPRDSLPAKALTDAALGRIYTAVEAEWQGAVRLRATRRMWGSVAAGLTAIVLVAIVWSSLPYGPVVASVARVESGVLESRSLFSRSRSLGVGAELHEGELLEAHGAALLVLQGGGSVRVASGTELSLTSSNQVALRIGEIYVDIPPGLTDRATFAVSTTAGLIEHVGTQFDVACVDRSIRVRVREGVVRLSRDWEAQKVTAGMELLVSSAGVQSRREFSAYDADWAWTAAVAPDYEIENRKLADFLQWAARESGRQLSWADAAARQIADRVELHGSVRGLRVDEALDRVVATTSLRLDLNSARIRISSAEDSR